MVACRRDNVHATNLSHGKNTSKVVHISLKMNAKPPFHAIAFGQGRLGASLSPTYTLAIHGDVLRPSNP